MVFCGICFFSLWPFTVIEVTLLCMSVLWLYIYLYICRHFLQMRDGMSRTVWELTEFPRKQFWILVCWLFLWDGMTLVFLSWTTGIRLLKSTMALLSMKSCFPSLSVSKWVNAFSWLAKRLFWTLVCISETGGKKRGRWGTPQNNKK